MFNKTFMRRLFLATGLLCATALQAQEAFTGGVATDTFGDEPTTHVFKDGKYVWRTADTILVEGKYEIRGKYIIMTDLAGPRACLNSAVEGGNEVGIYGWETWDNYHYLTVYDDDCSGRQRGFLGIRIERES